MSWYSDLWDKFTDKLTTKLADSIAGTSNASTPPAASSSSVDEKSKVDKPEDNKAGGDKAKDHDHDHDRDEDNPILKAIKALFKAIVMILKFLTGDFKGAFADMMSFFTSSSSGGADTKNNADDKDKNKPGFFQKLEAELESLSHSAGDKLQHFESGAREGWHTIEKWAGFSPQVSDAINQAAHATGCDPRDLSCIIYMESRGNPNAHNSNSDATGLGQFIPSTARQMGLITSTGEDHRRDPYANALGTARLLRHSYQTLVDTGFQPSTANAYFLHQQGDGGGIALMRHPEMNAVDALMTIKYYQERGRGMAEKAIMDNSGRENMTAGQFHQMWVDRYNATAAHLASLNTAPHPAPSSVTPDNPAKLAVVKPPEKKTEVATTQPDRKSYAGLRQDPPPKTPVVRDADGTLPIDQHPDHGKSKADLKKATQASPGLDTLAG